PACAPDTVLVVLLLVLHHSPLNLHSFPTRRSSDLEAHVLLVFFEPSPSDYIYYIVPGYQAGQVIDSEATDILADYIDRYYYSDMTEDEFFSKAFEDAADRIMKVTRSPWITVWIVIAVVAIIFLLFSWWKSKQKQKNLEAEQTKDILSQPIEKFGASPEEELTKK